MHCFLLLPLQVPFCSVFGNRLVCFSRQWRQLSRCCFVVHSHWGARDRRSQSFVFRFSPCPPSTPDNCAASRFSGLGRISGRSSHQYFLLWAFKFHCPLFWYVVTTLLCLYYSSCFCGLQVSPGFFQVEICVSVLLLLVVWRRFLRGKVCRSTFTLPFSGNQPFLLETPSSLGFGDPTVFRFLSCLFLLCNMSNFWHPSGDRCLATYSPLLWTFTQAALIHSHDGKYLLYPNNSQFTFPSQISP